MKTVLLSTVVGALFEWFDFYLYAAITGIVIALSYFPAMNPEVASMAALSTFAVGYIARPLGGVVFGHLGDRLMSVLSSRRLPLYDSIPNPDATEEIALHGKIA